MDGVSGRMRAIAARVLGYLLLASAVAVGIAFFVQQGMHEDHVAAVQNRQELGDTLALGADNVNAYPEPSVALYLAGVVVCLVSGLLILEPGLRHSARRVVQLT
ncbi:MAG: hypothetical protein ABI720_07910 [Actinomycetes bacterium]